jgi:Bacterial PH domain
MDDVRNKPALRVRRSGALVVAALIALVGTVPLAGAKWAFTPVLLIPLLALIWAWRAGTDVFPDRLRVRALFGSTTVPWARVTEFSTDANKRVSALLDNGNMIRLTGVTTGNLPQVLAAGGQELSTAEPAPVDDEPQPATVDDEPRPATDDEPRPATVEPGSVTVDDEVDQGSAGEKPA